jgi:hypothetical protein
MRTNKKWLLLFFTVGCSSATPPRVPGAADVTGRIIAPSGAQAAGIPIVIVCGSAGLEKETTTDQGGRFAASLSLEASVRTTTGDTIDCVFSAPSVANPQYLAAAELVFYDEGLPHPIQTVDLLSVQ